MIGVYNMIGVYIFISLISIIGMGIFWGCVSRNIRKAKGYEGGFALGFFFGIFALMYNASLPDQNLINRLDEISNNLRIQNSNPSSTKQSILDNLFI